MRTNVMTPGQELAQAVSELGDVITRIGLLVGSGALRDVALADLPAHVAAMARAGDQLEGIVAAGVAKVHLAGTLPIATTQWLHNEAGMSHAAAKGVLARGCAISAEYGDTGAAWIAGAVSRAHVSTITQSIDLVARGLAADVQPEFRGLSERALLGYALDGATPAALARKSRRIRAWADEWGMEKDADETERAQFLRFTPEAEGVKLEGYLSPESHALIATALEQAVEIRHREGTLPQEDASPGDDPAAQRARRRRQPYLLVLALTDICAALLENGSLGSKHGAIPRVTIDVDVHDLHSAFGGVLRTPGSAEGRILGHDSVRRLLCDAEISAALVTGARPRCTCGCPSCACDDSGPSLDDLLREANKDVVYVGRADRVVGPRLRRALEVREDGRCSRPGCGVPASRCRAHHVQHWQDGGLTDIDNCVLVCERHHRDLHTADGWRVEIDPARTPYQSGYFRWIPPPGRSRA